MGNFIKQLPGGIGFAGRRVRSHELYGKRWIRDEVAGGNKMGMNFLECSDGVCETVELLEELIEGVDEFCPFILVMCCGYFA